MKRLRESDRSPGGPNPQMETKMGASLSGTENKARNGHSSQRSIFKKSRKKTPLPPNKTTLPPLNKTKAQNT